jgi:hypothetical protein
VERARRRGRATRARDRPPLTRRARGCVPRLRARRPAFLGSPGVAKLPASRPLPNRRESDLCGRAREARAVVELRSAPARSVLGARRVDRPRRDGRAAHLRFTAGTTNGMHRATEDLRQHHQGDIPQMAYCVRPASGGQRGTAPAALRRCNPNHGAAGLVRPRVLARHASKPLRDRRLRTGTSQFGRPDRGGAQRSDLSARFRDRSGGGIASRKLALTGLLPTISTR